MERRVIVEEFLEVVVYAWVARHDLNASQAETLRIAVRHPGVDRERLACLRRVREDTLKSQVRGILQRTGLGSMDEVAIGVLREALTTALERR